LNVRFGEAPDDIQILREELLERLQSQGCHAEHLVAFSCKRRGYGLF
jgi:sRNA-binding carbon storage regulator CsrA